MINEEFLETFRVKSESRMSAKEREQFEKEVGYNEDMSTRELATLYEDVHAWYDCTMDEMEEEDMEELMPTYQQVMRMMQKYWFHMK